MAEDFHGIDLAGVLHQVAYPAGDLGQLFDQGLVQFQVGVAGVLLVAQGDFHLAPGEGLAAAFAYGVFQ